MATEIDNGEQLANAVNVVSSFLANEQISDLETCEPVECIAICVSALIFQAERLFRILEARPSLTKTLVIVGGIGHSTKLLYESISRHEKYKSLADEIRGLPEARVMERVLKAFFDVEKIQSAGCKILIEDKSTNCGSNAIETLRVLQEASVPIPKTCILIQDPTMSLRSLASFQKAFQPCEEVPEFICCPLFVPVIEQFQLELRFTNDIPQDSLWSMARLLELILGEVPRLRDDEHGYGPAGAGFIVHVEVPDEVQGCWQLLRTQLKDNTTRRMI